ncbi:MAG TPA: hypothetical protein PLU39_08635 [Armatimonadota bacterium]|nr:hypothetical protein [Armatimonadota bacterium]
MLALRISTAVLVTLLAAGPALAAEAAKRLPWQREVDQPDPTAVKPLPDLVSERWRSTGGAEGSVAPSAENGPWGAPYLRFRIKVDHFNAGNYPQGWPSISYDGQPPLDFSGWDAIQFRIRGVSKLDRLLPIRFILRSDGELRINQLVKPFRAGDWQTVRFRIRNIPAIDKVTLLHFFICESDYAHGDEITFEIGGFELCNLKKGITRLPATEAAAALYVGERTDTSDEMVILENPTGNIPALLAFETGGQVELAATDTVRFRFREMFTGKEMVHTAPLGEPVPKGSIVRVTRAIPLDGLKLIPGYYLITADVLRGGKSVLNGRVGSDDLYVKAPGESMTYTVLSVRTGMASWVRDILYGDLMCRTRIALPHVYDPLNKETFPQFVSLFAHSSGKHTEGNEAGDRGLVLAAEAFRKSGDIARARFAEALLKDSLEHMITAMQSPEGGTITWSNELMDRHGDVLENKGGASESFGSYDSNQMGEWLRPLAYSVLYFRTVPGEEQTVRRLLAAGKKAADFLARHATAESDGIPDVIRHVRLHARPDGSVQQQVYYQEGRKCDVYLGRALAGLAYFAYALQVSGEKVPERYWRVMDQTVTWSMKKMKPDTGWFDWQCEDIVEGGCHTFLGNIYIGEGLFGCYLASRSAGRAAQAAAAAKAAHLAYRYVTDHCTIRGQRYKPPLEFWVGPYVYWLFTEYHDAVGKDPAFQEWLETLHRQWAVDREWRDFLARDEKAGHRTSTNGALEISILGYLGLRHLEEIGKPYHLPR